MANIVDDKGEDAPVYLRPETAGAIFVDFKNVVDSNRVRVPFGICQMGKAFRNEIVAGNFIFRLREFEQMEIEYFIHPKTEWEPLFGLGDFILFDDCQLFILLFNIPTRVK